METPTSEEKILAALAHASVLFSFLGPVGPSLIWANQREKSKYVRFHALQAMGYQAFLYWAWFIGIFVIFFGCIFLMAILSITLDPSWLESPFLPLLFQPLIFLGIFGLMGLFFLTGIAGAVLCMLDRKFRYPIIGNWLERKLLNEQHVETGFEEWEDSWVSSVCHSTAIIQFWGVITPLILWFSQKGRSAKIRFQALQAVFYQLAAVIAYMAGAAGYVVFFFLVFATLAIGLGDPSAANGGELSPVMGLFIMILFGGIMLIWMAVMIAVPVYYLLALIASLRTLFGHNFKYPILGSILARKINTYRQ